MNRNGDIAFFAEYDAWGKRTVKRNALGLRRGYCQHEHWNEFDLIDMNGRMYDPQLGRFLSPDPYVQAPDNPQNFNRYSYCLNNPLKYTDPSGNTIDIEDKGAFYMNNGEKEVTGTVPNPGSAAWGVGRYGNYGNYGCNDSGYGYGYSSSYGGNNSEAYYISDPAAREIWNQVHYGTDYSGGLYSPRGGSSGYSGGGARGGGGSISPLAPSAGLAVSGIGAGAEWGKTAKPAKYGTRFASASKLTKVGAKAANAISKGATIAGGLITLGIAGYELGNGQANTHTVVDVGVAIVTIGGLFASAPVALGIAIGASIYGIASAGGLGLAIDKATDNWGNKIIYKREDEDY